MKRLFLFLFFVPGLLMATELCDYFQKSNNGDIAIKEDYKELFVKICADATVNGSYCEIDAFCNSIVIDDENLYVMGDYGDKIVNSCFTSKINGSVEKAESNWFLDLLLQISKTPIYWRR